VSRTPVDVSFSRRGAGTSEETLGRYFDKRPGRCDRIVLATKFGSTLYPADPNGGGAGRNAITPGSTSRRAG